MKKPLRGTLQLTLLYCTAHTVFTALTFTPHHFSPDARPVSVGEHLGRCKPWKSTNQSRKPQHRMYRASRPSFSQPPSHPIIRDSGFKIQQQLSARSLAQSRLNACVRRCTYMYRYLSCISPVSFLYLSCISCLSFIDLSSISHLSLICLSSAVSLLYPTLDCCTCHSPPRPRPDRIIPFR